MLHPLAGLVLTPPDDDRPLGPVAPAGAVDPDFPGLEPGARVLARITAVLPEGLGRVAVDGRVYTVPLPAGCKPGDELQLTVVAREPRVALTAAPRDNAPPLTTTLSGAGRFIAGLFSALDAPTVAAQAPATTPLLPGPPADTVALAARLQTALAQSGLFYESHQAQWVAGTRPLAEILHEPQARTAPLPPAQEPAAAREATVAGAAGAARPDAGQAADEGVHPALHDVVRHQLEALETGRLVWHGTMWPGQPARWEIAQQSSPESGGDSPSGWRTDLQLTLPRLGGVGATIAVGANGIRIALVADTSDTADLLLERGDDLRQALRAAGAGPATLTIARQGEPHE